MSKKYFSEQFSNNIDKKVVIKTRTDSLYNIKSGVIISCSPDDNIVVLKTKEGGLLHLCYSDLTIEFIKFPPDEDNEPQ